jgi:hypothetical protein
MPISDYYPTLDTSTKRFLAELKRVKDRQAEQKQARLLMKLCGASPVAVIPTPEEQAQEYNRIRAAEVNRMRAAEASGYYYATYRSAYSSTTTAIPSWTSWTSNGTTNR